MKKGKAVIKIFTTITLVKGIHAMIELVLGLALFIFSTETISNAIIMFVEGRLAGNPTGFVAEYITQFGIDLSHGVKFFLAFYLVSHAIVNFSMVYGIIRKPSYAYPLSILLFIGFTVYQAHSYFVLATAWLLVITIFDILFLGLLFYEYNAHLKKYSFLGKLKLIAIAKVPAIINVKIPSIKIKIEYPPEKNALPNASFVNK